VAQENVEIVRKVNELAAAGDWEAVFDWYAPDIEFRDLQPAPDVPELVRGIEAVRRVVANWTEVYVEFGPHVYEYIDAHPWVVCDTLWKGTIKNSGLVVEFHGADAVEVQQGKLLRITTGYADVPAALKAVGLEE